jgi:hypothetical protein
LSYTVVNMSQFDFERVRRAIISALVIFGFAPVLAQAAITVGPLGITGSPALTAVAGQKYDFKPNATVPEIGPNVTFWITDKPSWATFNQATGELSGTPPAAGAARDILISVVYEYGPAAYIDWFSIRINPAGTSSGGTSAGGTGSGGTPNSAPTISGSPTTAINVGAAYTFTPTAKDANNDKLTFSIKNKPSWAAFSTSSGTLSGTPTSAYVGTYSNIGISVSDGIASAALPAFSVAVNQYSSGTAQLTWLPPTDNTNGSVITNLGGYRIHYGTAANNLSQTVQITNPGVSSYTLSNLSKGTWYFAVGAYNSAGSESALSNVGSKAIP